MMTLIKNGHIIDPVANLDSIGDILIKGDRILGIRINGKPQFGVFDEHGADVIDANGLYVVPGLIDLHTHLREPGFEHKETLKTGTFAALKGGFTSVCCMPNTNPPIDSAETVEYILNKTKEEGSCAVLPIGAITKGQKGIVLNDLDALLKAGCIAFSDDGRPVVNSLIMRKALEWSGQSGVAIIAHCEDMYLAEGGMMNEGEVSSSLGLKGIPAAAEDIITARDIMLAKLTGGRLHIAHVSTKDSVELVRRAKSEGIAVTAETCPHYFSLTDEAVRTSGTNAKVNPPLRTNKDVYAIKEGLRDGTIDIIATDHAPHHQDEKALEFEKAPFGISGLETAFALSLCLVREGILSLPQLISKMSSVPARIIGIEGGRFSAGALADIMIFDANEEWDVRPEAFASKGKNTPFAGMRLRGRPVITMSNGKIHKIDNGKAL